MPATRKSNRQSGGLATGKQSTLSFNNRVTKNIAKQAGKDFLSNSTKKQLEEKVQSPKPKEEEVESQLGVEPEEERTEAERKAAKVTDKAINKYWSEQESVRIAKRVHQEQLSTGEKVLRYFDVSSQYGPCVGISRLGRWHRADRLGLNPPIEVLAVLLKESSKGDKSFEGAHIDYILNSTAAGSV